MMETGGIINEKVYVSPRPPNFSFKDNWMKELGVAGGSEDSQQTQPKTKNPIVRTRRPVKSEQPSTNERTEKRVNNCVPVFVERLDKDKDAKENVDTDPTSTERPMKSEQSIVLFTQREETVTQAENFRVRELVKKIESHPHREALQADLQQNNVHKPFGDDSKAMVREMGNVVFSSCAKQFQKCNAQNAFFIGIKE